MQFATVYFQLRFQPRFQSCYNYEIVNRLFFMKPVSSGVETIVVNHFVGNTKCILEVYLHHFRSFIIYSLFIIYNLRMSS